MVIDADALNAFEGEPAVFGALGKGATTPRWPQAVPGGKLAVARWAGGGETPPVGGPVAIVSELKTSAEYGIAVFIKLLAVLSVIAGYGLNVREMLEAGFRVQGKAPEIWYPDTAATGPAR